MCRTNLDNSLSNFSNQSNFYNTGTHHFLTVMAANKQFKRLLEYISVQKAMENGYENWVWLTFMLKEVAKRVPTIIAVEGDVSPLEPSLEAKHG